LSPVHYCASREGAPTEEATREANYLRGREVMQNCIASLLEGIRRREGRPDTWGRMRRRWRPGRRRLHIDEGGAEERGGDLRDRGRALTLTRWRKWACATASSNRGPAHHASSLLKLRSRPSSSINLVLPAHRIDLHGRVGEGVVWHGRLAHRCR
jgi:hypothetical protein